MRDRIVVHLEVPRSDYEELSSDCLSEAFASIQELVQAAKERQDVRSEGAESFAIPIIL
jgi:hypothetical protein